MSTTNEYMLIQPSERLQISTDALKIKLDVREAMRLAQLGPRYTVADAEDE